MPMLLSETKWINLSSKEVEDFGFSKQKPQEANDELENANALLEEATYIVFQQAVPTSPAKQ